MNLKTFLITCSVIGAIEGLCVAYVLETIAETNRVTQSLKETEELVNNTMKEFYKIGV